MAKYIQRVQKMFPPEAFEVDVFISGFATSHRTADTASRSQRAFIRLAKGPY